MISREPLYAKISEKSKKDPSFLKKLVNNPDETIRKIIGEITELTPEVKKQLSEVKIKVYLEKPDEFMIVIPARALERQQLSSDGLKNLSGGDCKFLCVGPS
jgi:hypothetical protein